MRSGISLLGIVALAGCGHLGQISEPAYAPQPSSPANWASGEAASVPVTGNWVETLGDDTLTSLVGEALENNPGLASTYQRVNAARASAAATYGRSLPAVNAGGDTSWSSTVSDFTGSPTRTDSSAFGLSLSASWEPDLWGRIGSGIAAANADLAASEADFDAAQLSLAANTALAWINLNEAILQESLARETLDARERTRRLTERRFRNGLSGALDVRLARSAAESANSTIFFREQQSGEARRRLEVLLGRYPANELEAGGRMASIGPIAGAGDPVSLLSRRPDVFAAEARIVAAGFRVDQARLALRPSLSLTGSISSGDDEFANIFDPEYLASRLAGSLTAPLFRGGALKAEIEATEARAKGAAFDYINTVLTAWREVEDALAADRLLAAREAAEARALEEAGLAETLAERQYQNGLTSIFNLIDAQTRRINSESSLISAQAARVSNRIQFHLALGGAVTDATAVEES